jgi:hypothetical protein
VSLFHLNDRARNLFRSANWRLTRAGDFIDQCANPGGARGNCSDGFGGSHDPILTRIGPGGRFFNQGRDVFGRRCRSLGEVAHFVGDNGESHSCFARPCGFHRRVQSQNIGLEGDLVNHFVDLRDSARRFIDFVHRLDHRS